MRIKKAVKKFFSHLPKSIFNFFIRLKNNKIFADKIESNYLDLICRDEGKTCIKDRDSIIDIQYDLQIVVPCYNIERFGKRCIDSIINQKTKYSFCVILVNDGSTDKTEKILAQYKNKNVIILNTKNGGSASARNKGLEKIYGKYVMFIDADDFLISDDTIENMLEIVKLHNNADKSIIVEFSYINSLSESHKQPKKIATKQCNNIDFNGFCWAKVFSSSLFKHIGFPGAYWFEDTVLHTIIYPMADECYKSNLLCYFYQINEAGMTSQSKSSNKTLDTFYVTRSLLKDREQLDLKIDDSYYSRFFYQIICNCNRLLSFSKEIQLAVFNETVKLFERYDIKCVKRFKTLFLSLKERKFEQYISFCKHYSLFYLNLD